MRVLFFDIETSPILGYTWRPYDDSLLEIEKDSSILCFAYRWGDEPTNVVTRRLNTERYLVRALWDLFDKADVIVAQNGDKFDIKVANALFIKHKLRPPSPYKTVDTLKLAKKYFRFTKNSLDFLSKTLLGKSKITTDKSLWFGCINGDEEAYRQMEDYCIHDVDLLYEVYHKLKSWHTGHPNVNLYQDTTHKCPVCGGDCQRRGVMMTRVGKYQRYQCKVCGAWSKGEKLIGDKVIS